MADVTDTIDTAAAGMTRKVGPLPAWAWAGMVVAGVTATILIRKRFAPSAEPAEPGAEGEPGDVLDELTATSAPFLPGGFVVGGGPAQATGVTGDPDLIAEPPAPPDPETNADWGQAASRFLISRGVQGTIATDAISRFLGGQTLTAQGQAVIDMAIAAVGAPPQPVPPPTVSPTPEPVPSPGGGGQADPPPKRKRPKNNSPKPAPAKVTEPAKREPAVKVVEPPKPAPKPAPNPVRQTITLGYGDTLYGLYRQVYGSAPSVAQIRAVAAFNGLSVGGPPNYFITPWRVGQAVKFPTQEP